MSIHSHNQREERWADSMPIPARKELHAHVEGCLTEEEVRSLEQLGFHEDDFLKRSQVEELWRNVLQTRGFSLQTLTSGTPYDDHRHWTRRFLGNAENSNIFDETRRATMEIVEQHQRDAAGDGSLGAYGEYEAAWYYPLPKATKAFDPTITTPFSWDLRSAPPIKEAEIHCTVGSDADPRLIDRLVETGMYVVITPKPTENDPENVGIVLTAQGTFEEIHTLVPRMWRYIQQAGGYGNDAKILVEKLVDWKQTPVAKMPRVIDSDSLTMN